MSIYPIEKVNLATGQPFGDGTHILYVNGEYRGNDEVGQLMHDFNCQDAKDMNFDLLAERTRYLKENPEGVSEMCKSMEEKWNRVRAESRAEGKAEGKAEGREEGALKVLLSLIQSGILSVSQAAQQMGLSETQFYEKLAQANIRTAQ